MDARLRLVALSPPYRHPARVVLARGGECGRLGREKPRDAARGCARTSIKAHAASTAQLGSSRPLWLCCDTCMYMYEARARGVPLLEGVASFVT
jgi:hypothetical protein